jgi:RNA polymerase sigma factor (sigma-70 family)
VKRIEFYLLNSLKNRLFDYHQEERRRRVIDKDEVFQKYEDSVIESIILTESELHMKREVERFMQSISPKQRRILHYYYQLNMSADEIATIFDITPDAVRRSISRSIKKIQSAHPEMILS